MIHQQGRGGRWRGLRPSGLTVLTMAVIGLFTAGSLAAQAESTPPVWFGLLDGQLRAAFAQTAYPYGDDTLKYVTSRGCSDSQVSGLKTKSYRDQFGFTRHGSTINVTSYW